MEMHLLRERVGMLFIYLFIFSAIMWMYVQF